MSQIRKVGMMMMTTAVVIESPGGHESLHAVHSVLLSPEGDYSIHDCVSESGLLISIKSLL